MLVARKVALVDFGKCQPDKCNGGTCAAAKACPSHLLQQDAPYAIPATDPFSCRTCGDCVRACPLKAIQIVGL